MQELQGPYPAWLMACYDFDGFCIFFCVFLAGVSFLVWFLTFLPFLWDPEAFGFPEDA